MKAASIKNTVLNLLYPQFCLHCQMYLPERNALFCEACLVLITLVQAQGRCRTCFAELHHGKCKRCIKRSVVIHRQMAACELIGPARSILNGVHSGSCKCISAAASLMAYQWLALEMPLPDLLVPLPYSYWQKQKLGCDPQVGLANELGKIFSVPVSPMLQSKFDLRHFLSHGEFQCRIQCLKKKEKALCDRRVLIVASFLDDFLFRSAGNELKSFFPANLCALAFGLSE